MSRAVAMLRALVRFVGLLFLTSSIIVSGIHHVTNSSAEALRLSRSMLPRLLANVNVRLNAQDYLLLAKAIGVAYIAFSLFTLLGVGRRFFALQLAVLLTCTMMLHYVDLYARHPIAVKHENALLKSISIIGGLVFVAASGGRHAPQRYHHHDNGGHSSTSSHAPATTDERCKKRE